jgi:photosystem II stability/assembly factor-like uncharacterized protein
MPANNIVRLAIVVPVLVATLLAGTSLSATDVGGDLRSMKMLTPQVGWAASNARLFWTYDGGNSWKDVTPKTGPSARIESVFFLDLLQGWVLLSNREQQLDVASTTNGGTSWSVTHLLPAADPSPYELTGHGQLNFADSLHGWMILGIVSSASAHLGVLLDTQDGGRTWGWSAGGSGSGNGRVGFVDSNNGWTISPEGDELYVTHDGATTWTEVSLTAPPGMHSTAQPTYELPIFQDSRHGFLPVSFSGPDDSNAELVLFATADGGATWRRNREMRQDGRTWATTFADSRWIVVAVSNGVLKITRFFSQTKVGAHAVPFSVSSDVSNVSAVAAVWQISFADENHGWLLSKIQQCTIAMTGCAQLLSTTDGGKTWSTITPPQVTNSSNNTSSTHSNRRLRSTRKRESMSRSILGNNDVDIRLGFDITDVLPTSDMKTWWSDSPYSSVSVYLPNSPNRHNDPNLNPAWVNAVKGYGWGLWPTWFGRQSACACRVVQGGKCLKRFSQQISSNLTTAKQQGVAEADAAVKQAKLLGLSDVVIYHDIEMYTKSSSCSQAVVAFLDGWTEELKNSKNGLTYAGVYGDPTNAKNDFTKVTGLDDVWIVKVPTKAEPDLNVSIWNLSPLCDPFAQGCEPVWTVDQRIHQYLIDVQESYGNTKLYGIDPDIVDAPVAVLASMAKPYTFQFTSIDWPNAKLTNALGVNDIGDVVGYWYYVSDTPFGFVASPPYTSQSDFTRIQYPNATRTEAWGINNAGTVVGYYVDSNSNFFGFWVTPPYTSQDYSNPISLGSGTFTIATGINDDGLIVGYYNDATGSHGFMEDINTGVTTEDIGGSGDSYVHKINGDALLLGTFAGGNSFLYQPVLKEYYDLSVTMSAVNSSLEMVGDDTFYDYATNTQTPIGLPQGAVSGGAFDISDYMLNQSGNNLGTGVVGEWTDSNSVTHGFIATPKQQ